jgi:hypothetical protein
MLDRRVCLAAIALMFALTARSHAQLVFYTTLDKYEHPKDRWERWSKTKVGDFIEFSDGNRVFERFEAIEVGDREMTIRTTYFEYLRELKQRDIKHVFAPEQPVLDVPTSVADDKPKLGGKEFAAKKEIYLGFEGKLVREVWYSDELPFDGLLMFAQHTQGALISKRIVASFKKGDIVFGKPDDKAFNVAGNRPQPAAKPEASPMPAAEEQPVAKEVRVWTSANGKDKLEAELVRTTTTTVVLKRTSDGKEFTLRHTQLSKDDRELLKKLAKQK